MSRQEALDLACYMAAEQVTTASIALSKKPSLSPYASLDCLERAKKAINRELEGFSEEGMKRYVLEIANLIGLVNDNEARIREEITNQILL